MPADECDETECPAGPVGRDEPGLEEDPENDPRPEEELWDEELCEDGREDGPELRLEEPELREKELLEDEPELLCEEDECELLELLCPLGGMVLISCYISKMLILFLCDFAFRIPVTVYYICFIGIVYIFCIKKSLQEGCRDWITGCTAVTRPGSPP